MVTQRNAVHDIEKMGLDIQRGLASRSRARLPIALLSAPRQPAHGRNHPQPAQKADHRGDAQIMLQHDLGIAAVVGFLGWTGMIATMGWLAWRA